MNEIGYIIIALDSPRWVEDRCILLNILSYTVQMAMTKITELASKWPKIMAIFFFRKLNIVLKMNGQQ